MADASLGKIETSDLDGKHCQVAYRLTQYILIPLTGYVGLI